MIEPIVKSFEPSAPRADYGEHEAVMQAYLGRVGSVRWHYLIGVL